MRLAERLGFRGRLIAAMIALVVLVSLVIGAMLMVYLFEDERNRASQQLNIGERLTREVMERRTDLNLSRLSVVVQDFGFRSAVASGDPATIDSALENHSRRARADFALLVNSSGELLASTLTHRFADLPASLLQETSASGSDRTFTYANGEGYEVLQVPVAGPGLRARLVAGFRLDQALAQVISRLSGTDVVFRARANTDSPFKILAATGEGPPPIDQELTPTSQTPSLLEPGHYFSRSINLGGTAPPEIQTVLMISREASLQDYYRRAQEIALLVSAILILAILLALVVARYLGKPVLQLADYARAVGDGETPSPPDIRIGGELKRLRNALGDMLVRLREREAQIRYAATHDDVTGLGNRNALMQSARELFEKGSACTLIGFLPTARRAA